MNEYEVTFIVTVSAFYDEEVEKLARRKILNKEGSVEVRRITPHTAGRYRYLIGDPKFREEGNKKL